MKKLLWATVSISLLSASCKSKKSQVQEGAPADSVWEAPMPANENPAKYDSLKNELNKRRKNKQ